MKLALRLAVLLAVFVAAFVLLQRGYEREAPATDPRTRAAPEAAQRADLEPAPAPVLSPEGETVRESVASDSDKEEIPGGKPIDPTLATLVVRAVSRESKSPLQGVSVFAHVPNARGPEFIPTTEARAKWGGAATSGVDGRVELEVLSAQELQLECFGEYQLPPIAVPALAPGERRTLEVEFQVDDDLFVHGRLVDAETRLPVAGGVIWPDNSSTRLNTGRGVLTPRGSDAHPIQAEVEVPSDGTFRVQGRSWQSTFFSARAPGYARTVFALDQGYDSPDRPLEVRLSRSATLEVAVLDGSMPVAGAIVVLTASAHRLPQADSRMHYYFTGEELRWSAKTDLVGMAELFELPSNVPFLLTLTAPEKSARQEGETLEFAPGERRTLELRLDAGATIVGRIEDTAGHPIDACKLWRVAASFPMPMLLHEFNEPAATAISDPEGRFRFKGVPVGSWHVGPEPHDEESVRPRDPAAIAAMAQLVTVEPSTREIEVVLRVDRGLYIEGNVVDPSGTSLPQIVVMAMGEVDAVHTGGRSDSSGLFRLGPLPAGQYSVQADGSVEYASSDAQLAAAGSSGIVVRLRKGGQVLGRVMDATGSPRKSDITLIREGGEFGMSMWSTPIDGTFRSGMLAPGRYTVSAATCDGLWGRRAGLAVGEGETLDGIEVVVTPGARLRLRYEGEHGYGHFVVVVEGVACRGDGVPRGEPYELVVPSGAVEIRWGTYGSSAHESQFLTLSAGEERELVWKGKP